MSEAVRPSQKSSKSAALPGRRATDKAIRPRSAAALRIANRAVRQSLPLKSLDNLERLYLEELMATRDANEGIAAFLEKRKPAWVDA